MKKGLIITAIVLVVLILIYFGVKGVFLYNYNGTLIEDDTYLVNFKKELAKNETVSITHTDLTSEETYYDYEDISFRNDYLNGTTEIIGNEDETKIVNFKAGEDILLSVQKEASIFEITTEFKEILDEENISNDIEIMKYIVNNYNKNLNIFSSIKNFEKSRAINIQAVIWMNSAESITKIVGDYEGYIISMNNDVTYAVITHDADNYVFTFYNNYPFVELTDFLSTIVFA